MTVAGESNCEGACGVGEIAWLKLDGLDSCCCGAGENNLDLDSAIIALISSLKLFIIACKAFIVTGDSTAATWFVDILLNDRMA